ncbi:hypothetical protein FSOLCH5_014830 [Fusarium solani]
MVAPKRSASPLEGAVLKSTKKPSSRHPESTAGPTEAPPAAPVRVIVSLRSESKARRNDPEANGYLDRQDDPADGSEDQLIEANPGTT